MKRLFVTSLLILGVVAGPLLPASTASASIAGFQAGRIIDDTVMTAKNSMSVNDIQNFLNSKVPSCDTNGTQNSEMNNSGVPDYNGNGTIQRWEWGKKKYNQTTFTCLKNKTVNGVSAARLIYNAAQEFNINPKVLIVLMQKEQGLVTDTWPLNIQYRSATGYGCPDTAACSTQYYGLKQQLTWASTMHRAILDGGGAWSNEYRSGSSWYTPYVLGTQQIPWNPNISVCGYSTTTIQNRATQVLYNYTPYRPNQAALNAGYGTGNGCSSYGNRNFYLYFTDWFGSTTVPIFKIGNGNTLYLSYGDYYYAIPNMDIFRAWGLSVSNIKTVSASQISSYTQGPDLTNVATFGGSSTAYFIDKGKYYSIPSMGVLNSYGYPGGAIETYTDANLRNQLSSGKSVTSLAHMSDGAIYYINSSKKHIFPDYSTFATLGPGLTGDSTLKYNSFSNYLMRNVTEGYPILREGSIIKAKNSDTIYLYNNSGLWPFTYNAWLSWGKRLDYSFSGASVAEMTVSPNNVPILASDGTDRFLVDSGKKHKFSPAIQSQWNLDNAQFTTLTTASLAKLNTAANVGTLIGSKSGGVYIIRNNEKLAIPSAGDFTGLGYSWGQVQRLGNNALNLVPTSNSLAFSPGSLVLLPNNSVAWIDTGFVKHTIPSLEIFNAYGFSWKNVRSYGAQSLDDYTDVGLQRLIVNNDGDYYLADQGKRLSISTSAYGASQYDFSGTPQTLISDKLISGMKVGSPLTRFIQGSSSLTVYMVENGQKRPISSPASLFSNGGSWSTITKVSNDFLDTLPTGSAL